MTFELAHNSPVPFSGRALASGRKLPAQKPALKMKEVMAIQIRLQMAGRTRELALFNRGILSKLRECDLLRLRVEDVAIAGTFKNRAAIVQTKTGQPSLRIQGKGQAGDLCAALNYNLGIQQGRKTTVTVLFICCLCAFRKDALLVDLSEHHVWFSPIGETYELLTPGRRAQGTDEGDVG